MELYVEDDGEGIPIVLLHGLTATHRYVVMGVARGQASGTHAVESASGLDALRSDCAIGVEHAGHRWRGKSD